MALLERIRNVLGTEQAVVVHGRWYGLSCAALGAVLASLAWGLVLAAISTDIEVTVDDENASSIESKQEVGIPFGNPEDKLFQRLAADDRLIADKIARHPELLGVRGAIQNEEVKTPPEPVESQTSRFMFGDVVPTPAPPEVVALAPTEHQMAQLPPYTIEPPDILFIEAMRVAPKAPYHIQSGDELQITAEPPEADLAARGFFVDPQGRIDLGPRYGKVEVRGLTSDEVEKAVCKAVEPTFAGCVASVTVVKSVAMQPITGEHLVNPDGTVNLGTYGQVGVAGMTLDEAKEKIEEHLSNVLDGPRVSVAVHSYNSRVYYVIVQNADGGDIVWRLPITGNETVLDAISQVKVGGASGLNGKVIWIARPHGDGVPTDVILPVNWQQIADGAATATNYQVFPGDRIFITDKRPRTGQKAKDRNANHYVGDKR